MIGSASGVGLWIKCGQARTIRNAATRTIRNAIPVLSGTLTACISMNPKADSGPSNFPNSESFGFFLTQPAENRVVEGLPISSKSWIRVPLIVERSDIRLPIDANTRPASAALVVGRIGR